MDKLKEIKGIENILEYEEIYKWKIYEKDLE